MGRHDIRPARVLQMANQLLETKRIRFQPPWYEIMGQLPPSETLVRPVHRFEETNKAQRSRRGRRKPSKMFQPIELDYPEDKLRKAFFNDHPWELARPKVVMEETGNDSKHWDWSHIHQPGKKLDGDRLVFC
jgi:small subunit ribosomal protein S23